VFATVLLTTHTWKRCIVYAISSIACMVVLALRPVKQPLGTHVLILGHFACASASLLGLVSFHAQRAAGPIVAHYALMFLASGAVVYTSRTGRSCTLPCGVRDMPAQDTE